MRINLPSFKILRSDICFSPLFLRESLGRLRRKDQEQVMEVERVPKVG